MAEEVVIFKFGGRMEGGGGGVFRGGPGRAWRRRLLSERAGQRAWWWKIRGPDGGPGRRGASYCFCI